MLPLSSRICQCIRQFFVKRPKSLAATSNLRVEQNLVHLGRFLHFSQKVVGVNLRRFPYEYLCISCACSGIIYLVSFFRRVCTCFKSECQCWKLILSRTETFVNDFVASGIGMYHFYFPEGDLYRQNFLGALQLLFGPE